MVANIFEPIIRRLIEVGFYEFLLFLFSLAMFYALLKKSKVLGESPLINAVIAFVGAFLVFGYPVIIGISLTMPLTTFFTQAVIWILLIFVGLLLASFFYKDLPGMLAEQFKRRTTLYEMLAVGLVLLVTSGLISVLWQGVAAPAAPGAPTPPQDVLLIAAGVIIFIVVILIGASTVRME